MNRAAAGFVLLAAFAAQGEELLRNGGFDEYQSLVPSAWSVYLHQHDVATLADARADANIVYAGEASARLDNPVRYDEEPMNNWSQHVQGDVSGKRLLLRGAIKTAGDAAGSILVQCGLKRPYQVLQSYSTSTDSPVSGDRDWTPVEMTIDVPPGAEFVTVRCVMEGVGTVWFDSLSMMDEREARAMAETAEEDEPAQPEPQAATSEPTQQPEAEATEVAVTKPRSEPSPPARRSPRIVSAPPPLAPESRESSVRTKESDLEEMLRINTVLQETVDALRETNTMLMDELRSNRNEIAELRYELEALRGDIGALNAETLPPNRRSAIPPLVPGNDPTKVF